MTKAEAIRNFKRYNRKLYIDQADYWTAHLLWTSYIDGLCKDGQITDKQFSTWSTPFPYGKRLKPTREMLELEIYERS